METITKFSVLLIGIAGTPKDFLLSLPVLKSCIINDESITKNIAINILQYQYIDDEADPKYIKNIINEIVKINPDLLGFSVYVWNFNIVVKLTLGIKSILPNIQILYGGPEISINDINAGRFNPIPVDFIIYGEGERPFHSFLKRLTLPNAKQEKIDRFAIKKSGKFIFEGAADSNENDLADILQLPSPFLTGVIEPELLKKPEIRANIETQRGCIYRCAYCLYHKHYSKIRYRNPSTIVEEIEYIYKQGISEFRIIDANFFSDKQYAGFILSELIKKDIHMAVFFEVNPESIDKKLADLICQYGALSSKNKVMVGIGIQTLNQKALKSVRRPVNVCFFNRAFELLKKANAIIKTDIILGLPHETKQTYLELIEYIVEKMRYGKNYLSLSLLRVLPGSDMEKIAAKKKLVIDTIDNKHFVYSTPDMPREDMLECLRLNAVAFRFLCSLDLENRIILRDKFFQTKDQLKIPFIYILEHFKNIFSQKLKGSDSD
ncbi:MAG: B12-binding domain-containing radical SAM protein, partial [Desulfobacterales bacterium]|nr:B12-binding domain-containing radical SAM protein [Desulfobacterales bacterium]